MERYEKYVLGSLGTGQAQEWAANVAGQENVYIVYHDRNNVTRLVRPCGLAEQKREKELSRLVKQVGKREGVTVYKVHHNP